MRSRRPEYPEYRVYAKRGDFVGSDVFELFPGEFDGDVQWWNPCSVYIREDVFGPFAGILRKIEPNFDWYGENRLLGSKVVLFADALDRMTESILAAHTPSELEAVGRSFGIGVADFLRYKSRLSRMTADLSYVVTVALRRDTSLWILGL